MVLEAVSRGFLFVTGPPGSGKTALLVSLSELAARLGKRPVFVSVHPLPSGFQLPDETLVAIAHTMDELVELVVKAFLMDKSYVIIDGINYFYVYGADRYTQHLHFILALLRSRGGAAAGIYRSQGWPPTPGGRSAVGYATHFGVTWKSMRGLSFRIEFLKPSKRIVAYRLSGKGGVEWL